MKRVAINGMGRIGRLVFRGLLESAETEVVAVNEKESLETVAYLLSHDGEHAPWSGRVSFQGKEEGELVMEDGRRVRAYRREDASDLPWGEMGVDLVLECTGAYTSRAKAQAHLDAGARRVLVSAAAGEDVPTIVYGINEETAGEDAIVSGASCSTVGLAPMAKAINDFAPIESGIATTIHALTATQMVLANPQRKGNLRRSRTALTNIIPTTAAAAKAVGLVIPELKGKLTGSAIRVPVVQGSLITLHAVVARGGFTASDLNAAMKEASDALFGYTEEQLVSQDAANMELESVFDATQTKVCPLDGGRSLVEVAAWFDNETSYVAHFLKLTEFLMR